MINHFDQSIVLFKECLLIKPNSATCYFALSEIYLKQKNHPKALDHAQKAYDLNPKNKWYVVHLADIFFAAGNYHKSATYYQILFNDFGEKNIDYRYRLVESFIFSNQNQKAIHQLNIIELETGKTPELSLTKHDLYNDLNKKDAAKKEIDDLLLEYPHDENIRLTILDYYLQTNQLEKAKEVAANLVTLNSDNGNTYLALADIAIRTNNVKESFDYLEKGFSFENVSTDKKLALLNGLTPYAFDKVDPNAAIINNRLKTLYAITAKTESDNAAFLLLYGTYLNLNQNHNLARQQFKRSTQINPSDYRAWDALLNTDYSADMFDSLFFDGQLAMELYTTQPMVYLLTGIGGYESKHFDEAETFLLLGKDFVINDKPLSSEFEYQLGKCYWKNGNQTDAELKFAKALDIEPKNAKVYNGHATLLLEVGDYTSAKEKIKQAITIDPRNEHYFHLYGQILLKLQLYAEALIQLERAVVINHTDPEILEHYGDALFLNGKTDNAVEIWLESKKYGNPSELLKKKIRDKKYYEAYNFHIHFNLCNRFNIYGL